MKPKPRHEQNTLIIKELPATITSQAVLKIFSDISNSPTPTSARADTNNTWFVNFTSEEAVRTAYELTKNMTYEGKALKVRFKTESSRNNL